MNCSGCTQNSNKCNVTRVQGFPLWFLSDQQQSRRQQPGGPRPAKRSHASPLDRDPSTTGNTDAKAIKPAGFTFRSLQTSLSSQVSQPTHSTINMSSSFPAAPVFGTGFSSTSNLQQSAGEILKLFSQCTPLFYNVHAFQSVPSQHFSLLLVVFKWGTCSVTVCVILLVHV